MELSESETSARNLSPELRRWLVSGGTRKLVAKAVELDETDDLSIAMAMIVAENLRHRTDSGVDAMLDDIRFKVPIHADIIAGVVDLTRQLIDRVSFLQTGGSYGCLARPARLSIFRPHAYRLPDNAPLARRSGSSRPALKNTGGRHQGWWFLPLVEAFNR